MLGRSKWVLGALYRKVVVMQHNVMSGIDQQYIEKTGNSSEYHKKNLRKIMLIFR